MSFALKAVVSGFAAVGFKKLQAELIGDDVGDIKNQVKDLTYQLGAMEARITDTIKAVVNGQKYSTAIGRIKVFIDELNQALQSRIDTGDDTAFKEVVIKLYSKRLDADGLPMVLSEINSALVGEPAAATEGLLLTWARSMHEQLQSSDYECDIQWYLQMLDQHLVAGAIIQLKALMLLIFSSEALKTEKDKQTFNANWTATVFKQISGQAEFTYKSMHPAVRSIKPDYFTPINYDHWYILKAEDSRVFSCREVENSPVSLETPNGKESVWRLKPLSSHPGRVEVYNGRNNQMIHGVWWDNEFKFNRKTMQTVRCTNADLALTSGEKFLEMKVVANEPMRMKLKPAANSHRFYFERPTGWVEGWAARQPHWFWDTQFEMTTKGVVQFDQPPPANADHYYTLDSDSEAAFRDGYRYEGVCGWVYRLQLRGSVPFYRFKHVQTGEHFYTSSQAEHDGAKGSSDWVFEKIACYLPTEASNKNTTIHRLLSTQKGLDHMYTTDVAEVEVLRQSGWKYEGSAGLAFNTPEPETTALHRWSKG